MVLYFPFLLFIRGKTTLVIEAMDVFYKLIRAFTWMYSDILQLIDPASFGHGVIHCGGEVFKECSSTFHLIFTVNLSGTLWFPLLMFPLASGVKEVKQVLKPGTIIRLFLHSLKVVAVFHQSAEETEILVLLTCLPIKCGRFQCFSWGTRPEGLEGLS